MVEDSLMLGLIEYTILELKKKQTKINMRATSFIERYKDDRDVTEELGEKLQSLGKEYVETQHDIDLLEFLIYNFEQKTEEITKSDKKERLCPYCFSNRFEKRPLERGIEYKCLECGKRYMEVGL